MLWKEILAASIAMFSVFGVYCALRTLVEWLSASERVAVAVEVRTKQDADVLDMLLHEARSAFLRRGHARIVVLVSTDLMDGTLGEGEELLDDYIDLLSRYGAECYLIDP